MNEEIINGYLFEIILKLFIQPPANIILNGTILEAFLLNSWSQE